VLYQAHPSSAAHPDQLCDSLVMVPRWVFAFLRGPLLSSHTPLSYRRISSDSRVALMNLYSSLPPPVLVTALYPALHPYKSTEKADDSGEIALSWDSLRSCGCRLFLLDTQTALYIYLAAPPPPDSEPQPTDAAEGALILPELEFPPPRSSLIWRHLEAIRGQQLNTPSVVVCAFGTAEAEAFEAHLIEDSASADSGGFGIRQFLDFQAQEVHDYLKASGQVGDE